MVIEAHKKGYTCGTVLFRGANVPDLPITSAKLNTSGAYRDGSEISDYVHEKYCGNNRKMYGYGSSLGACLLGVQLINQKENTKYDGAVLYALPWSITACADFFYTSYYGVYSYVLG